MMASDEEMRSHSSVGPLMRTPSASPSPTVQSSLQSSFQSSLHSSRHSKRTKSSRSTISMQRSSLVPQKDSVHSEGPSIILEKKESEVEDECNCGPDLYSRVLGPTADETILTGVQAVIDLCNKLRICGDKEESPDEEPEREQDIPERDTSSKLKTNRSQTERSVSSAGFQVNPSSRTIASQTMAFPQMVSQILQTVGLTPEMVSKVMQTSFQDVAQTKPSVASNFMQTSNATVKSGAMQTSNPELKSGLVQTSAGLMPQVTSNTIQTSNPELRSIINQTSSGLLPQVISNTNQTSIPDLRSIINQTSSSLLPQQTSTRNQTSNPDVRSNVIQTPSDFLPQIPPPPPTDTAVTQSDQVSTASKGHMIMPPSSDKSQQIIVDEAKGDEHKCISPPEPPADHCKCCKCSSSYNLKRDSQESRSSEDRPPCICGTKRLSKCRCGPPGKKSNTTLAGDQERPEEVKYAVTKISKYKDFTLYEVMKSTRSQPKQMPKGIEGVFVLRKKNGSHDSIKSKSSRRTNNGYKSNASRNTNGTSKVSRSGEGESRGRSRLEAN